MLKNRLRRLCTACRKAPLIQHLSLTRPDNAPPMMSADTDSNEELAAQLNNPSFTAAAMTRTPCWCEEAVWLCYQCGQTLRSSDTTYRRVWTWRTRYSTSLGGNLGTGIGEGCQGVKCGRGQYCLAAQEIELEVDCEADDVGGFLDAGHPHHPHYHYGGGGGGGGGGRHGQLEHAGGGGVMPTSGNSNSNTPLPVPLLVDVRDEEEPGYFRQEMVGVGGVVKHKAKKRVMVGACVLEYEDERDTGRYLVREEAGLHRCWCAWCWRVVPAKKELATP